MTMVALIGAGWLDAPFQHSFFMKEQTGNLQMGVNPKMVGFPNNHGFSLNKNDHFGVRNGDPTRHLRKHPNGSVFIAILVYLRSPVMKFTSIFNYSTPVDHFLLWSKVSCIESSMKDKENR